MTRHRYETTAEWSARLDAQREQLIRSPHFLYRAYDEFDVLLYIGCTVNVKHRLSSHKSSSAWRPYMATFTTEVFEGFTSARTAETAAILAEGPLFNSTQDDINRTQANRHEAHYRLAQLGIFRPHYDIPEDQLHTFAETPEWEAYIDECHAYEELVAELRAELKAGAFPYLTAEDRLASYLAMREQRNEVAA